MASSENTFLTVSSRAESLAAALDELARQLPANRDPPTLAILFLSSHYSASFSELGPTMADLVGTSSLIGCSGESIVAGQVEIEKEPGISLWLAWLPEASVDLMHLRFEKTSDGGAISGWPEDLQTEWPPDSTLLVLGDPYTFPAEFLLERLNEDRPGTQVLGGMASGASGPGESRLLMGPQVLPEGAVAVLLRNVTVRPVVSQGCRPVGPSMVITKAAGNEIYELGGQKAQLQLKKVYDGLPNCDKELMQYGVHLGRVVNEYQETFEYGDFLVRNVIGVRDEEDSLVVGDYMRVGQTVKFHLRDASTADQDLRQLLHQSRKSTDRSACAALLFTCNGRGSSLFKEPHHDARLVADILGPIPTAGFFCQGEIGPIGGKNFLHGFTANVAIFY